MAAATALSWRGKGLSVPNPNVGCLIVKDAVVVGRGWTQAGGRPHAEAMALAQAGAAARGATAYVTLEPCAHKSERGPSCADSLIAAGLGRVVIALVDPDPRTAGKGIERLKAAGIAVSSGVGAVSARRAMAGWLSVMERGRPFVTLKLATSLDGCIAMASGESQWITGEAARAHGHLERALADAILVGRGTYEADNPLLDVRLPGLEERSPVRLVLSSTGLGSRGGAEARRSETQSAHEAPPAAIDDLDVPFCASAPLREPNQSWITLKSPEDLIGLKDIQSILVEGGAETAAAFLEAGLVDRILLYRAPILIGAGKACLRDIGLTALADAHNAWTLTDSRQLGKDRLEVYEALSR
jgi:diaminohydroxyphosphoribosylaminopyrimidine deaminase / 5-amino-6-(5-phosphoribosylamino)uracil reductase